MAETVQGEKARKLVAKLGDTLGGMSGMLNTLLDINQIEAGAVCADLVVFPIDDLLDKLKDEFTCHAQALGLELRVVSCGLSISSDPRLLEQMLRNLLSNALKYTRTGKVLLGCRRREGLLSIEIRDTGVGIDDAELQAIFEERHQLDNAARERSRGLDLGLSIVRRLGGLLGHRVGVRSQPGKGSVFAIEVKLSRAQRRQPLNAVVRGWMNSPLKAFAALAQFWSSRTIPKRANSSNSFSRARAIARPQRLTASPPRSSWREERICPTRPLTTIFLAG